MLVAGVDSMIGAISDENEKPLDKDRKKKKGRNLT